MIETFLNTHPPQHPKMLPLWKRGLDAFNTRFTYVLTRYLMAQPVDTKGTRMIESLLSNIPENYFLTETPDPVIYKQLDDMKESFNGMYDSVQSHQVYQDTFVKQSKAEVFSEMSCSDPENTLPFGKPYGHWMDKAPIKILNMPSLMLPTNYEGSQLMMSDKNEIFLFGINFPLLLMKYIKFAQFKQELNMPYDPIEFIHGDVIYAIRKETFRNWLINVVQAISDNAMSADLVINIQDGTTISNAMFQSNITELLQFLQYVETRKITVSDFLACKWLGDDGSFIDYMNLLLKDYAISASTEYKIIRFVRDAKLIQLILSLIDKSNTGKSRYSQFIRKLDRVMADISMSSVTSRINNKSVVNYYIETSSNIQYYIKKLT